ncbi:MAG TPA: STAS domain-containing protein [Candidatus Binatia bacterium]|nr:STAS domain-containing protein [Candidatus Binatia bacterium]
MWTCNRTRFVSQFTLESNKPYVASIKGGLCVMGIELRSESSDDAAIIYCSGEVKAGEEGHSLRTTVAEWLRRRRQVTVDLGNVEYIDSGGLGILVSLYPIARTAGATLKYVNLVTRVDYSRPSKQV